MLLYAVTSISAILFFYSSLSVAQIGSAPAADPHYRETINQYCLLCHNDATRTANLSLEQLDIDNVGKDRQIWEKVLRKLNSRSMPPAGMPRPNEAVYSSFADYLESALDSHASAFPEPGAPLLRRMNRTEYINAVNELFAVALNADAILPADHTMLGFDNVGNVLTLSPLLAEKYVAAAREIRYQVLGNPDMQPEFIIYTVPAYLLQEEQMAEDLPFGSRGGVTINHHFPLDGEYVIQIRLQRNSRDYIRGLVDAHRLDVHLDGKLMREFSIGGEKKGRSAGLFSSGAQGDVEQEYYERNADETLELRFFAHAGTRKITVTFPKITTMPEGPYTPRMSLVDYAQYKGGVPGVRTVAVQGPYTPAVSNESASRKKVFICKPAGKNDSKCAGEIITNIARRAYRRPPSADEMAVLMDFYKYGLSESGFEEGIGLAIERILAGPEFLFLVENVPAGIKPGAVFRISDLELATRLALFLWSSIPDEALLDLAEAGKLSEPVMLQQQIIRMLKDSRSDALVQNFASQWLALDKLNAATPDGELFPYFDDNLRQALQTETRLFFEHILRQDLPLVDLLAADYSFINERLANHYNIPKVFGSHFRKVTFPDNSRGGLLGHGSILTVTSYANRTAPTIRGKWVLENILGAPPPPPPPNIPGLIEKDDEGKALTMRQAMEKHRANPVCASCHKVMDPLGFALEKYDAIGRWRTIDAASNSPVDSSGALPDGTAFDGPIELREALIQRRQGDFILTVIDRLFTYALNRELNHNDAPAIRTIMKKTESAQHRLSSLIMAIVESTQFQKREVIGHDDI